MRVAARAQQSYAMVGCGHCRPGLELSEVGCLPYQGLKGLVRLCEVNTWAGPSGWGSEGQREGMRVPGDARV